ncbi:MAG TPA: type II toxin-antitoxin system VapC family toxin [Blastocatellia bacterium]|nr:type II toxin-antitoxin system VapC family toxin [Blastocatellia bacterium]HMV84989.1 type II toxin-antitoxin system VapC family toxin [Blastocatellia bacterium]HMX24782.1 type II toxin-antitoxin system VapC family toxin [Blastocatellia bacterium]HMY72929.1 type II toxin-antitoxin system VapC family toxin [Blastocatellia bacterium]HMZ18082.1 type II toxin-antitoxin system VapC family toxin [Blastocatellia bacterium]
MKRLLTYLDSSCLIAAADFEINRSAKVYDLLREPHRNVLYSSFVTLETLSLAIHYGNKSRENFFRYYLNQCLTISDKLIEILNEARRQSEKYGIVGIDACHIAAAIIGSADEFYTFEKLTRPMFRTKEIKVISLL